MNRTLLAVFAAAAVFTGCGNNPPELKQIYNQINFINTPGSAAVTAELLVLVNADDEDGADDIESVHIINDDEQFFWSADKDNWTTRDSRGMKWKGSQRLSTIDGKMPEIGEFRVLVTDQAGERDEDRIFIPLIKELPVPDVFAELIFQDEGNFVVKSSENKNIVSFYDSKNNLLGAYNATPGLVNVKKLRDGAAVYEKYQSIEVSYYSNSFGAGIISGPYLRP